MGRWGAGRGRRNPFPPRSPAGGHVAQRAMFARGGDQDRGKSSYQAGKARPFPVHDNFQLAVIPGLERGIGITLDHRPRTHPAMRMRLRRRPCSPRPGASWPRLPALRCPLCLPGPAPAREGAPVANGTFEILLRLYALLEVAAPGSEMIDLTHHRVAIAADLSTGNSPCQRSFPSGAFRRLPAGSPSCFHSSRART
jgi:hypothetical protein